MDINVMTLGIFAHANAGKTTLTEQFLVHTSVKKNSGRVDNGDTTTDNLKVERDRGISVRASMVTLPLKDRIVQLIDTPGHVDFSAEVERAINVLDGAVLVVSGVEGVEPQTQVIWKILQEKKVPTIIFINKMDRVGADYNRVLNELQNKLCDNILPLVKVEQVDNGKKLSYEEIDINDLIEDLANVNDEILDKYVSDETIDARWLENKAIELARQGEVFFVYGGSALLDDGMIRLINGIEKYLPVAPKAISNEFSGYIYTVKRDNNVRELYVKVLDGVLQNRQEFIDDEGNRQRIRTVTKLNGSKREGADELKTGEIGIITGLNARCGEMIGSKDNKIKQISFVNPLFHTTVSIDDKSKLNDLARALEILNDEDPDINLKYNKITGEMSIDLMGPLQAEIIGNLLFERFGLIAKFSDPIIIQKERPVSKGIGDATFDKVSKVTFSISPLPIGSGIKYESKVSTDYLFTKYQKQIERLIGMYCKQGLYGWEVTDAEIILIDGKSDSVCSEPSHYNVVVPLAYMRALKASNVNLLEPEMEYEMTIPDEYFKTIISVTSSIGVDYENITHKNGNYLIPGKAPLNLILDLPQIITRLTGGHGSMIRKQSGFILRTDNEIIKRNYTGPDPRNEVLFLMNMNSSLEHIDRPSKRR